MLNQVVMMGRLTADPEVRETANGKKVATFSVAVERDFKNAEGKYDCDFFPAVMWGERAEMLATYFKKGQKIIVQGRMQTRSYEKDGTRRTITEIFVNNFNFVESAKATQGGNHESFGQTVADDEKIPF